MPSWTVLLPSNSFWAAISRGGAVFSWPPCSISCTTPWGLCPWAFPAYVLASHPQLPLRRAVFQRRYNVLYVVSETEVRFLTLFSTAQNPADIEL